MFQIRDIFSSDKKFGGVLKSFDISSKIRLEWVQIVGEPLSKVLFFGSFQHSKLLVLSKNPAWVNEIRFHKDQFLKNLETVLGSPHIVHDILVRFEPKASPALKKDPGKNPFTVVSFEDKISQEIKRKVSIGYHLCGSCKEVYSLQKVCAFCRSKGIVAT